MTRKGRAADSIGVRIVWSRRALTDLGAIDAFIAADDPVAAERWVGKLIATAEAASRMPLAGRVVPEKARTDVREVLLRSYRLVYRVHVDRIVILTVFEGHRRLPAGVDDEG